MKIQITSDRKPWANDRPHEKGAEIETDDSTAKGLMKNGHAKKAGGKKVKSDE